MRGRELEKSSSAFRTISEVAAELDVPKHVLRFWEGKFPQLRPMKRGGGRRYYRPEDVDLLRGIRWLLYSDGYTIKGVQRILRDNGVKFVKHCWRDEAGDVVQGDPEPSFQIPNLAAEAASAARRTPRAGARATAQPASPPKAAAPVAMPALTFNQEQKKFLKRLLDDLEGCHALLQGTAEVKPPAKPKSKSSTKSSASAR
jgi:DNA-binding transcriptional MerR regulator